MSSRDKNLPYEILTLSHFGFKYCSVQYRIHLISFSNSVKLRIFSPKMNVFFIYLHYIRINKQTQFLKKIVKPSDEFDTRRCNIYLWIFRSSTYLLQGRRQTSEELIKIVVVLPSKQVLSKGEVKQC